MSNREVCIGVVTVLAIAAGVAALASAAIAYTNKKANDKAVAAQKKAVEKQRKTLYGGLDPEYVNEIALKADKERAKNRLALQQEIDPELAAIRQSSKQQLLADATRDPASRNANKIAGQLFSENINQDPRLEKIKSDLIDQAQQELSLGATLPPEFQAELVQAGLSKGGTAGVGLDRRTIGGDVGRVLGSAGIALQRDREAAAERMVSSAESITAARANILNSIFPTVKLAEDANAVRASAYFGLADSNLPEAGIGGTEAANLQIARVKGQANLQAQTGALNAQKAVAQGQFQAALIGAGAQAVSGAAGAYGAGAGGGAGAAYASGAAKLTPKQEDFMKYGA